MRIGVNALYLLPGRIGGPEIYLRSLINAIAEIDSRNEYFIFTNTESRGSFTTHRGNIHEVNLPVRASFRPFRILWEQLLLPFSVKSRRLDLLFSPGFTSPVFVSCPSVVTVYDMHHMRHPEYFFVSHLVFWRLLVFLSVYRSSRVITLSENSRRDTLLYYNIPSHKISVTYLAPDHRFRPEYTEEEKKAARKKYNIDGDFLLCVSTIHPHKNLYRLLRAYKLLRSKYEVRHKLVLVGLPGFYYNKLKRHIKDMNLGADVIYTGWIPFEDVPLLYSASDLLVFPSTFEGFGLPVLEAFASGIPVACSNIPPVNEVAGDAALFFNPSDEEDIAVTVHRLIREEALRSELVRKGLNRAKDFSWAATARQTLKIFEEAASI